MATQEPDVRAQALYEACPTVKPAWSQLGETTRSVWRERAVAETGRPLKDSPAAASPKAAMPESLSLF